MVLEGQYVGEMSLVDPGALVSDTLGLEATELEGTVGRVFEHHIGASCSPSDVLEVLSHQTIATAWIGSIDNSHLLLAVPSRVTRLLAE